MFSAGVFFAAALFLVSLDCNSNGMDDADEIARGAVEDCNGNRVPDECEAPSLRFREDNSFRIEAVPGLATPITAILDADFNRDGNQDLAVIRAGPDAVTIHLNQGNREFSSMPAPPQTQEGARDAAIADADGDGDLDLVITQRSTAAVTVMRLYGGERLHRGNSYPISKLPYSIRAGDLDADGDPDLATGNEDNVTILRNRDGSFEDRTDLPL